MRRAPSVLAVAICLSAVSCTAASADLVTSAERAAPAVPPASTTGSAPAGLHVDGKRLVNSAGEAVVLRGVNRAGTEYKCVGGGIPPGGGIFDGPVDDASIAAIKSWRANAVRIGLNEDCWLGINGVAGEYAGAAYQHAIADYVSLLKANGVYAILSNLMNARRWTHASPSFLQFDLGNPAGSGRAACIRAIEEAAAYVVRGHFESEGAAASLGSFRVWRST